MPQLVREFIGLHSEGYGKAKLVLSKNRFFIEARDIATMERLQSFECIKESTRKLIEEERQRRNH